MGFGKPITKWALQETTGVTVTDSIGAFAGTATSGNVRSFTASTNKIAFANPIIPLGAKTIRFKFRKNASTNSNTQYIMSNTTTGTGIAISVLNAGGAVFVELKVSGSSNFYVQSTGVSVLDGKWHEIMFTWDGTTTANAVKLYVDDMTTPNATATASSTETTTPSYNLQIGVTPDNTNVYGMFDIDDIWITNGASGSGTVVAWWKCDDTAATAFVDSSSNNWTPTITETSILTNEGGPIIVSDGVGGYARRFNGRSDRITFTNQVLPLGAKSIQFKIRKFNLPSNDQYVIDNVGNSGSNGLRITVSTAGKLTAYSFNGGSYRFAIQYPISICDGQWHTILISWDGTINTNAVKMYVDDMATPVSQATASSIETASASNNLMIGMESSTAMNCLLEGDLQNIQINIGTGTERTDPKDLQIGDFIRCHYQAASGAVGTFSQLGTANSAFIPPASSAAPNGDFYFICTGFDFAGRAVLVADRNIQHSLNWDKINEQGMTNTGREISL